MDASFGRCFRAGGECPSAECPQAFEVYRAGPVAILPDRSRRLGPHGAAIRPQRLNGSAAICALQECFPLHVRTGLARCARVIRTAEALFGHGGGDAIVRPSPPDGAVARSRGHRSRGFCSHATPSCRSTGVQANAAATGEPRRQRVSRGREGHLVPTKGELVGAHGRTHRIDGGGADRVA